MLCRRNGCGLKPADVFRLPRVEAPGEACDTARASSIPIAFMLQQPLIAWLSSNPSHVLQASNRELVLCSRIGICAWAVIMGVAQTVVYKANIPVYLTGAPLPLAMSATLITTLGADMLNGWCRPGNQCGTGQRCPPRRLCPHLAPLHRCDKKLLFSQHCVQPWLSHICRFAN